MCVCVCVTVYVCRGGCVCARFAAHVTFRRFIVVDSLCGFLVHPGTIPTTTCCLLMLRTVCSGHQCRLCRHSSGLLSCACVTNVPHAHWHWPLRHCWLVFAIGLNSNLNRQLSLLCACVPTMPRLGAHQWFGFELVSQPALCMSPTMHNLCLLRACVPTKQAATTGWLQAVGLFRHLSLPPPR